MRALLGELGDPQRRFRSIHVVGSNGKTTTTLMIEAILRGEGLLAGATVSPHVRSWAERLTVGDFEGAVERVRPAAERVAATQFEAAIAAAFSELAEVGVEAAVVEAGLGGRLDATNVIDAPVVVLTNVSLEHTEVLGPTREAIAAEKLAVVTPGATVVLSEPEWEGLARAQGAADVKVAGDSSVELAEAAAGAFLGRAVDPAPALDVHPPGRLEQRGHEVWDGAHNPAGVEWLVERLTPRRYVVVTSILRDKDATAMLGSIATVADRLIVTQSSNPRALPPGELAALAPIPVEVVHDPAEALEHARALAGPDGAVLVTGSLYLLQDLSIQPHTYHGETR